MVEGVRYLTGVIASVDTDTGQVLAVMVDTNRRRLLERDLVASSKARSIAKKADWPAWHLGVEQPVGDSLRLSQEERDLLIMLLRAERDDMITSDPREHAAGIEFVDGVLDRLFDAPI